MMMMDPSAWGIGMMVVMGVVWVAVLVAIVVGVVFLVRLVARRDSARPDALSVLDDRFARGDIDRDEYESRRDLLREARR